MALILKSEVSVSKDGTKLYVTDKTGEYVAITNPGGWGAPNVNIYESCLVCFVIRKGSEGDEVFTSIAPSVPFLYDDSALNSDVKVFEITNRIDAVIDVVLARLPVSLDNVTYVDTGSVSEGDFYYYNNAVYHYTGGEPVLVEDWTEIAEDDGVLKDICHTFMDAIPG
jgi:hypothetical protein